MLLQPGHHEPAAPFRAFNRFFDRVTARYTEGVRLVRRHALLGVVTFLAMAAVTAHLCLRIPGSLMPDEDQGWLAAMADLPPPPAPQRRARAIPHAPPRPPAAPNPSHP